MQAKVRQVIVQELIFEPEEQETFDQMLLGVWHGVVPTEREQQFAQKIRIAQEDALEAFHRG